MSKSMIGLDPLAWLSPAGSKSISSKKKSKKKAKKKVSAKKSAPKKTAAEKTVAKKKIVKNEPAKKKVTKKKVTPKSVTVKKVSSTKASVNKKTVKPKEHEYVSPLGLDVKTLEVSFNLLAPKSEELVENFYNELFKKHPAVVPMFKNTTPEEQQKKLLSALKLVINNIRKPDVLADALKGLGSKHQGYGAEPVHYQAVATTLIEVMKRIVGDLWTNKIQSAWEHALTTIAEVMLTGYEKIDSTNTLSSETVNEENPVSNSTIKLNDVQDISQVAELHKQLGALLNQSDIIIDGANVERIDTASLQLLTSVFMHAETYGTSVSWKSSSDALKQSAKLLGLTEILKL